MLITTTVYTRWNLEQVCGEREVRYGYRPKPDDGRTVKPDTRSFVERLLADQAVSIGCEQRTEAAANGATRTRQVPSSYAWIAVHHYLVGMKYAVIVFAIMFTFKVLPSVVGHLIRNRPGRR
ncbi:MAG: hypothetical protein RIM84_09905 [Alphaproteobacteria bacterium]